MCAEAVRKEPDLLKYVPNLLKTQEICAKVVSKEPYQLKYVPDYLKKQNMCAAAAKSLTC